MALFGNSQHQPMYVRIAAPLILAVLAILILSLFLGYRFVSGAFERQYYEHWAAHTQALARTLGPVLNSSDIALGIWIGEGVAEYEDVVSVEIENLLGNEIFKHEKEISGDVSETYDLEIVSPLDGRSQIGSLRVSIRAPQTPSDQPEFLIVGFLWPVGVLALLAGAVYLLIRSRVLIPIQALHDKVVVSGTDASQLQSRTDDFGASELNELDAAFTQTFWTIHEKEKLEREILQERAILFDAADKALKTIDMGMVSIGVDGDSSVPMRMGLPLPDDLTFLETVFLEGAKDLGSELQKTEFAYEETSITRTPDDGDTPSHISYEVEIKLAKQVGWYVTVAELAGGATALIYRDVSAELRLRQQIALAHKNETIGRLTGGVAHDFNNLLNIVHGNLEVFLEKHPEFSGNEWLLAGLSASRKGGQLTRSLLTFARESQLKQEVVDLNEHVGQTMRWMIRILPENISVETVLQQGLWSTTADVAMTENALLNLVINARDAMADGGSLTIETANVRIEQDYIAERGETLKPGRYVVVSVSDTGTGITDDIIDKIFDPFFTTKETGKGSGVGLSMVIGFMKQSNGTVRVYSEPGVGTTFKLFFPATYGERSNDNAIRTQLTRPTNGASVLLVEDDPLLRRTIQELLEVSSYIVTTAEDGQKGLQMYKATPDSFDVVLTDVVMPGKYMGPQMIREMRKIRKNLRVIFMSGYSQEATVHGNGVSPKDLRLIKPVSRQLLVEAIERLLTEGQN